MEKIKENANKVVKENLPSKWHCDIYCRKIRHVDCEGKAHIDPDAPNLCTYFDEMLY